MQYMKRTIVALVAGFAVFLVLVLGGLFLYLTGRPTDRMLATNLLVSSEWIEIVPDAPLTKTRYVQEIDLEIAGYRHDVNDNLSFGSVRISQGKIVSPQIEAYDKFGQKFEFQHTGYTMSRKDLVGYTATQELPENVQLTRLRIRSDEPFICNGIFWRNRNLK